MAAALAGLSRGLKVFLVVDLILVVAFGVTAILVLGGKSSADDQAENSQRSSSASATDASSPTATGADAAQEFASPTGNIVCDLSSGGVTCTIAKTTVAAPQIDGCAGAGTGHVITLTGDGVDVPCTEDVPAAAGSDVDVLQYGSNASAGDYTCSSASNGMTCMDASGAGFRIATAERAVLP